MKKIIVVLFIVMLNHSANGQTNNTNLGTSAGNAGNHNTSIGVSAGDVVTGDDNTFLGMRAGFVNTTGYSNTFLGYVSGQQLTTGYNNTAVGASTGSFITTHYNNTFVGYYSGGTVQGNNNTFVGTSSGVTQGNENVGIGSFCLYNGNTSSNNNVAIGYNAARTIYSGINNTVLGHSAGYNLKSGSSNVFIGYNVGYNETGSNKLYIDNSNTTTPLIYGDFAAKQLGINSRPNTTHALTVGGTIYATGIYVNGQSITDGGFEFWTKVGTNIWNNSGNVGIGVALSGTNNPNNYKLAVKGKIGAQEVQIENNSITWSDFVFNDNYKLLNLIDLEKYIKANHHLPEIPTQQEVRDNGILLSEMNAKLLQKVEELTLYVIEMKKEIEALKEKGSK